MGVSYRTEDSLPYSPREPRLALWASWQSGEQQSILTMPMRLNFSRQVAGQIAIAIENALAYEEITRLKDRLAEEKLYLEEELRSEMGFERIIGNSPALKHVLQLVDTVAPSDSTVLAAR